jgi:Domain of unknown function (DUF1857)
MSHIRSRPLRHEHIIRINDPANVAGEWLTREQLWQGLLHTVHVPQELDASIEAAIIESVSPRTLRRKIHRGSQVIADEVALLPYETLQVRADAASVFAGSTLTIRIEEPAPEMLFLRFTYELYGLESSRDQAEDTARCSAYQNANIDRVRAARQYLQRTRSALQ